MVQVPGSHPAPLAGARRIGPAPADERFEITVRLRSKKTLQSDAFSGPLALRQYLSREQFAASHGADEADIAKVRAFAEEAELVVVDSSAARRSVFLSGTVKQIAAAFGTTIDLIERDAGVSRHCTAPLNVPSELGDIVEGVFGISNAPVARPHLKIRPITTIRNMDAANTSYTAVDLARLYNFPVGMDGAGQCIGIIELGGGYRTSDINVYFNSLKLPAPHVITVSVDGATNHPTLPTSADGEVMLDIEVAGAVAPKALIAMYFAPNTDKGFLDAITTAIHDTVNKPSVISISWGAPEKEWTEQSLAAFDQAFQAAAAMGVTICCAAGDAGSGDQNPSNGQPDGLAHADFPGSSPAVLCCGGTRLIANGAAIGEETVWNDDPIRSASGGGVSDFFAQPAYQNATGVPLSANPGGQSGRGVPDVAGNADPSTGYRIRVDGFNLVFGGTSAVSPLWAGLIALMNQQLKKPLGFANPLLYGPLAGSGVCRDITSGDIGAYRAGPGWDPCTGWGSPNGAKLLGALGE